MAPWGHDYRIASILQTSCVGSQLKTVPLFSGKGTFTIAVVGRVSSLYNLGDSRIGRGRQAFPNALATAIKKDLNLSLVQYWQS